MREEYTQKSINQFYTGFKKLPTSYNIERVHQLINNPYAEARHKVNFQFNYLKPIIMTSTILIGLSILFLWINSIQETKERLRKTNNWQQEHKIQINPDSKIRNKNKITYVTPKNHINQKLNEKSINSESEKVHDQQLPSSKKTVKNAEESATPATHIFAKNSKIETIDGNKFILELTFDELRNLGFYITHYSVI